jgi:DNA (cytosine-5)-methyltransferase 1
MLKVVSLFSGIGAFEQALTNLGVEYELVNFCEIDKYAIKAYCSIHNVDESLNLGDISKVHKLNYCDLLTYGFPCTDISVAGKQEGLTKGEGTRSGLLWEVERLLKNSEKPKYLIMENVKNLVSKKFKPEFDKWLKELEGLGYNNYWQVLNAKDYGIPQNRERIFCVSIRKDIDKYGYTFPEKQELKLRLKDMLEDNVDEKHYINNDKTKKLLEELNPKEYECIDTKMQKNTKSEISKTILASCYKEPLQVVQPKILKIANESGNHYGGGVFDADGLSPTLTSSSGGGGTNNLPKVCEQRSDEGFRFFKDNVCGTIRTIDAGGDKRIIENNYRIRKLTPLECWRLMGFKDEAFYKAKNSGISNTQLYKMAGNSIVVTVLEAIFKNLL